MSKLPPAFAADVIAEFSAKARAMAERPAVLVDTRNAVLVPEVSPFWYLVEVWPNKERQVYAKLAERRFGVYLPECSRTELLFPGYVFVFVWDLLQHRSRIEAIDGVVRVILDVNGVPLFLTDAEVDKVRYLENCFRPVPLQQFAVEVEPMKKKRRRKAKPRVVMVPDEIVCTRPGGWIRGVEDDDAIAVDSHGWNQTLMRALGLCS